MEGKLTMSKVCKGLVTRYVRRTVWAPDLLYDRVSLSDNWRVDAATAYRGLGNDDVYQLIWASLSVKLIGNRPTGFVIDEYRRHEFDFRYCVGSHGLKHDFRQMRDSWCLDGLERWTKNYSHLCYGFSKSDDSECISSIDISEDEYLDWINRIEIMIFRTISEKQGERADHPDLPPLLDLSSKLERFGDGKRKEEMDRYFDILARYTQR